MDEINVTAKIVQKFLQAEHGERIGLYSDGSIAVGENVGNESSKADKPVVSVQCPGFENLSILDFVHGHLDDECEWDDDLNRWIIGGGAYDDYEIIRYICENKDVSWEAEDISSVLRMYLQE